VLLYQARIRRVESPVKQWERCPNCPPPSMAVPPSYSDEQTPLELTHRQGQRLTRHLYGRQTCGGEIIIGNRQLDAPKTPDRDGIETNHAHALELFPFLQDLPFTRA
jgi:hypothetical protein